MLLGVAGFQWFGVLSPCLPYLIIVMLFFTFCRVNPIEMRLYKWHWLILAFQIFVGVGCFYLLRPVDLILAQGIMLCFVMPSATAAAIITSRLGGNMQTLTSFTFLSNLVTAIFVPAFFPLVNPDAHMTFLVGFFTILKRVFPLLVCPFLAAWALRVIYDFIQKKKGTGKTFSISGFWVEIPFYTWAFSLVVLMAKTTHTLIYDDYNKLAAVALFVGALVACVAQFFMGKLIGFKFPAPDYSNESERISAGQALGQKNTTLAIWMAQTYLNPVSSLAPAAYIIWQNIFNSWQLARKEGKQSDLSK